MDLYLVARMLRRIVVVQVVVSGYFGIEWQRFVKRLLELEQRLVSRCLFGFEFRELRCGDFAKVVGVADANALGRDDVSVGTSQL